MVLPNRPCGRSKGRWQAFAAVSDENARCVAEADMLVIDVGRSIEMNMAQNVYDDPSLFAGYSPLPRQVHGLDGAPEWLAIRSLLPDVTDKRAAGPGCGFGWAPS